MKPKPIITLAVILTLVLLCAISLRAPQSAKAQDQQPPAVPDRISFGMVAITSGQTLRVTVANTIMPADPNLPPGPIRVVISFRYSNGNQVRDSKTGEVIRKVVDIERGDATFLDVDYDHLPPGPTRVGIRPIVFVQPPQITEAGQNAIPPDGTVPTVEVINNANGRTQFAVFTHPAVVHGFNPQPDPPIGD